MTATMTEKKPAAKVASPAEWLVARREFLAKEKEFTRMRDELSRLRRELPWEKVEKNYVFEGPDGTETLAQLFSGHSQLIVYHFMFGPGWKEGCPSCSFLADSFDGAAIHMAQRDTTFVAISRATLPEVEAFKKRMGWKFKWVSSNGTDFNYDYKVTFTKDEAASGKPLYNFGTIPAYGEEAPGASMFVKQDGQVFHTYSTYARGLDMFLPAYHWLDTTAKGRDEADMKPHAMAWVRHHDRYSDGKMVDVRKWSPSRDVSRFRPGFHLRRTEHVGTAALGCPAKAKPSGVLTALRYHSERSEESLPLRGLPGIGILRLRGVMRNPLRMTSLIITRIPKEKFTMATMTSTTTTTSHLLQEFRDEAAITKRLLERVPADKLTWKPHPKSMSLGQLAGHIASIPGRISKMVQQESFDVLKGNFVPPQPSSLDEILATLDQGVRDADQFLQGFNENSAAATFRLMKGDRELFRQSRAVTVRTIMLNHWYHHRGQLSVYLRLLEVPLPVIYGRSADSDPFA